MIIAKTASRNVAFKSGKLAESVFKSQADVLTREVVMEGSFNDKEANFQDLGHNADLYTFKQTGLSFSGFVLMKYNIQVTMRRW